MIRRQLLGGALWTPSRLGANVIAWFDAAASTTLALSGASVTSWASRAGSISAAPGSSPTYSATGRNGLPAVLFSGTQNLVFSANTGLPTGNAAGFSAIVAYSPDNSAFKYAISYGGFTANDGRDIGIGAGVSFISGGGAADINSGISWANADHIVVANTGSSSNALRVDGSDAGSNVTALSTGSAAGEIGANTSGSQKWSGSIQEIVLGDRQLSASERQKLEGYLAWKWGLRGLLPSDHPYKNGRPN